MKTKLCAWALLSLAFAACDRNNIEGPNGDGSVAAEFRASIYEAVDTRASGTEWADNDKIGISTIGSGKTSYSNTCYIYNKASGKFRPADDGIYFQDAKEVTFRAYYPYRESAEIQEGKVKVIADAEAQLDKQAIDYLFATGATGSIANPQVSFTDKNPDGETDPERDNSFHHCMSQMSFNFIAGVETDFTVEELSAFTVTGLKLEGTFDTETGRIEVAEGVSAMPLTTALADGAVSASLICLPQEVAEIKIAVILDGNDYKAVLPMPDLDKDGVPDGELFGGYNYSYDITVNKTGIAPGECTIGAWDNTGSYPGDATDMGFYYDTESNTYYVYNADGLMAWVQAVQEDMTLNCTLNNTITLPEVQEGQSNWTPIGSVDNPYRGRFEGAFMINNLTIYEPDKDYVGVFRSINNESHVKIHLRNADIVGRNYVGAVTGNNDGDIFGIVFGSIKGVDTVGGLTGINKRNITLNPIYSSDTQELRVSGNDYVGGIAGVFTMEQADMEQADIHISREQSFPVNVSGNQYVGGVVGITTDTLRNIYLNKGTVMGQDYVGGIVGYHNYYRRAILALHSGCTVIAKGKYAGGIAGASKGDIIACFSTGDVSGEEYVGGIVGQNDVTYNSQGTATNSKVYACYTTGAVSGTSNVGTISGHNLCQVTSCYYVQGDTPIGLNEGATYENAKVTDWNLVTKKMNDNIPIWEKFRIEYHNDTQLRTPPYVTYTIR